MVLITRGAGFIGANLAHYWVAKLGKQVLNLDKLNYAGNLQNLASPPRFTARWSGTIRHFAKPRATPPIAPVRPARRPRITWCARSITPTGCRSSRRPAPTITALASFRKSSSRSLFIAQSMICTYRSMATARTSGIGFTSPIIARRSDRCWRAAAPARPTTSAAREVESGSGSPYMCNSRRGEPTERQPVIC
jgi:hypothetical protein